MRPARGSATARSCSALTERAHRDLAASGEDTYAAIARRFVDVVADHVPAHPGRVRGRAGLRLAAAAQDQAIRARGRVWYWSYHQVGRRAPRLMAFVARARTRPTPLDGECAPSAVDRRIRRDRHRFARHDASRNQR
jgi:hypothetical protein